MVTVPIDTTADIIAYHRDRSWHFWQLVDDELDRGELEEASNKIWGASAHAIKAAAEIRGWPHYAHNRLEETVHRLVNEENAPRDLLLQYMTMSAYHQRFYGSPPAPDFIRMGQELAAEFIRTLESLD